MCTHSIPLGEDYRPGLVPPPLPRRQPIELPFDEILVSPVLSVYHQIAATRAWNVLRPTDEFHLLASTQASVAMAPLYNESSTNLGLTSFTIRVESNDRMVDGLSFTINASRPSDSVTVGDVLNAVHRQCSWYARGGNVGQRGWIWGGLRPSVDEDRVAILALYEVAVSAHSANPA